MGLPAECGALGDPVGTGGAREGWRGRGWSVHRTERAGDPQEVHGGPAVQLGRDRHGADTTRTADMSVKSIGLVGFSCRRPLTLRGRTTSAGQDGAQLVGAVGPGRLVEPARPAVRQGDDVGVPQAEGRVGTVQQRLVARPR